LKYASLHKRKTVRRFFREATVIIMFSLPDEIKHSRRSCPMIRLVVCFDAVNSSGARALDFFRVTFSPVSHWRTTAELFQRTFVVLFLRRNRLHSRATKDSGQFWVQSHAASPPMYYLPLNTAVIIGLYIRYSSIVGCVIIFNHFTCHLIRNVYDYNY